MKFLILVFLSLFFLKAYSKPVMNKGSFSFNHLRTSQMNTSEVSSFFNEKFAFAMSTDYHKSLLFSYLFDMIFPSPKKIAFAVYKNFIIDEAKDYRDYTMGLNFLAYKNYQSHLYLKAHLGAYKVTHQPEDGLTKKNSQLLAKLSAIFELTDETYYLEARMKYYQSLKSMDLQFFNSFFRLGFSPYKKNQFKSWLILQVQSYLNNKDYMDKKGVLVSQDYYPFYLGGSKKTYDDFSHLSKNIQFEITPLVRISYSNLVFEAGYSLEGDYFTHFMFYY